MPKFAIRVDASRAVGMGHLSRARAFAQYLSERQLEFTFFCGREGCEILKKWGFPEKKIMRSDDDSIFDQSFTHALIDINYKDSQVSTEALAYQLASRGIHPIIIDSMPPDNVILGGAHEMLTSITLVTPYLDAARFCSEPPKNVDWLAGPNYTILGAEFSSVEDWQLLISKKSMLVVCGGSDPNGLSVRIARLIHNKMKAPVTFVIGPLFSKDIEAELIAISQSNKLISLKWGLTNLASEMLCHSHVVGQVGLTRYEGAALGRYGIYLAPDNRYREYYENFSNRGLAEIYFEGSVTSRRAFFERLMVELDSSILPAVNREGLMAVKRNGIHQILSRALSQTDSGLI